MLVLGTKQHRRRRNTWIVPISRSLQHLVGILLVFVGIGGTNSIAVDAFSTNTVVPLIIPVSSQHHKNCRPYPPLTKHHYNHRTLHPTSMTASTATARGSSSLNAKEKEANTGTNNNDKKKPKKGRSSDWKKAIEEFKASVLDEAYLPVPIRGTCVNMALTDYPQTHSSTAAAASPPGTLMPGAHKHLGGVKDTEGNGCIYGVPANANAILCMYPTTPQNTQIVHGHQTARVAQRRHQEQVRRDEKERTKQARKQKYGRRAPPPTTTMDGATTTPPQYEEHGKQHHQEGKEETEWTEEQLQAIGAAQATTSRRSRLTRRGSVPGTYAGWKLTPEEEAALHMDEEEDTNNKTPGDHNPGAGGYTLTTIPLPERIVNREMKWLRGIIANGYLWAIPAWADCVLCVDIAAYWHQREKTFLVDDDEEEPDQDTVEGYVRLLPLPKSTPGGNQRWQWHGAGINIEQTAIYCIPSNAQQVLKVDLQTQTTSYIEIRYDRNKYPDFTLDVTNKWYGGIVGNDNAIYGIPYRACGVLRIDSVTETATIIGPNYGIGKYFWHGGVKCQSNGKIYAHPSHADTVLVIDTSAAATAFVNSSKDDGTIHDYDHIISELTIHRASYDHDEKTTNYKWLGGSIGADGNIYCPACDTSALLKINPTTDYCETFGYAGTEKNKWQGGILSTRDDCIYCIPANGIHVCRIYTGNNTNQKKNDDNVNNDVTSTSATPVQLIGDLSDHKDKWQGASMGEDGALYFIPENGYRVMKVTPPPTPPVIIDGKLPDGDVKIELI